jgi:hypothetical protein
MWILGIVAASGIAASAGEIVFDYSIEFTGGTPPVGTTPWLRASFDDSIGGGQVRLTLSALNLTGSEFISELLFNLDPVLDPTQLTFTGVGVPGSVPNSIGHRRDIYNANGAGKYDVQLGFPAPTANPAARFTSGETVVFDIGYTGVGLLNANSFNVLSPFPGGQDPFASAARVRGIQPDGRNGWVGASLFGAGPVPGAAAVPDTCGTGALLGLALLGLGALRHRLLRK